MVPDYRLDTTLVKNIIHTFRQTVASSYPIEGLLYIHTDKIST